VLPNDDGAQRALPEPRMLTRYGTASIRPVVQRFKVYLIASLRFREQRQSVYPSAFSEQNRG